MRSRRRSGVPKLSSLGRLGSASGLDSWRDRRAEEAAVLATSPPPRVGVLHSRQRSSLSTGESSGTLRSNLATAHSATSRSAPATAALLSRQHTSSANASRKSLTSLLGSLTVHSNPSTSTRSSSQLKRARRSATRDVALTTPTPRLRNFVISTTASCVYGAADGPLGGMAPHDGGQNAQQPHRHGIAGYRSDRNGDSSNVSESPAHASQRKPHHVGLPASEAA